MLKFFLFPFIFFFLTLGSAQKEPYLFVNSSIEMGNRPITSIAKDKNSFLWIGTYGGGLKKFDGIEVKTYRHDILDETALSSSIIHDLMIDEVGQLWVGSNDGLHLYNSEKDNFFRFLNNYQGKSIKVHAINSLDDENILVGTHQSGLFVVNLLTKSITEIDLSGDIEKNNFLIHDIKKDISKRIWVATNLGLFQFDSDEFILKRVKAQDQKSSKLLEKNILSILVDNQSNIWLGTTSSGILKLQSNNSNYLSVSQISLTNKRILALEEYRNGKILCGTENDGLFVLDYSGNIKERFFSKNTDSFSIASNSVWSIFADNEDRIWIGYYDKGVDSYDPRYFKFNFLKSGISKPNPFPKSISGIAKDKKGLIWFSCIDQGVYAYNPQKNDYHYLNDPENKLASGINSFDTPSLYIDKSGNVWVASWYSGIYLLKNGTDIFINFNRKTHPKIFKSNRITSFSEDINGKIWIGTFQSGLISYEPISETFTKHDSPSIRENGLNRANIRKVLADSQNNVWLGTRQGVFIYDKKTSSLKSFNHRIQELLEKQFSEIVIFSLYEDLNKKIWIGTDGFGAFCYNPSDDTLDWFNENNKIPLLTVNSITQTNDGFHWFGGDDGLVRFDPFLDEVKFYNSSDGLMSNMVNKNTFYKDNDILYLGTNKGVNFFNYNKLSNNALAPKIKLKGLKISNKLVEVGEKSPLTSALDALEVLELDHYQSSFSINYVGINYTRGKRNQYAYRLKGFEKDWNYVGNSLTANYTNIRPGNYTFELDASNTDGTWNEEPFALPITIRPPWWSTNIAYLIYILVLIGLLFVFYKLVDQQYKERRRAELEKDKRQQMEELNEQKIQFFTNISHEFRTPLTLILNPMESLISRSLESAGKEVRQKYMTVYNNANRMLRLIDELMDFRKIQFNKTKLQVERCSLSESLSSVVSNFTIEASDRNISLDTDFNLSKDEIWLDTSMFEKIVFNLLSNAFKATTENGKIAIICNYHNSGVLLPSINTVQTHPAFEIIIRDSGFGIKKENLDKVFERFYQDLDNSKQNYGGTGIGLEVVSTFIKYHKGKIEVESEENIGTAMKVFFPAGKSHFSQAQFRKKPIKQKDISSIQEEVLSEENIEYFQSETKSKPSLLIVEDNSQLRKYLKSELNDNYKIYEANNGKIGLDIAKTERPNIIVTDVMMPEMDGIEMCSLLKLDSFTKTIPVVMLTAKVSHKDRILGISSGADVYLKKPFSIELLKSHLEQLLQSKSDFFEVFMGKLSIDTELNNNKNNFLTDVVSFINENLSNENLVIEDIAEELNISKSKLYRNIKNTSGISANQLIRKLRIERSKELLLKSNFSISEICYNVGFSSPSYFTKRFKEYTGMVPKQFKFKHLNENEIGKNNHF